MSFATDQALWYNNGVWGQLGYAVPNFGDDPKTLNQNIHYLVDVIGRNLFAVMHHHDVDLRTPPSINTLTRIHKLVTRARQILSARAVPPGTPDLESLHSSPAPLVHLIYPVPYFKVRNPHLKQYCGLILACLSEAMQHTENRKPIEFSTAFAGAVGQYLQRVYVMMATELFNVEPAKAKEPAFTLTDAELKAYDPGKFFTSTEMVDVVPPLGNVPTEDDLKELAQGIPATMLVGLARYPDGGPPPVALGAEVGQAGGASTTPTGAFAPAPTP